MSGAKCPRLLQGLPPQMSRPYGDTSQPRMSRAHRRARSHRISFGVRGRPSSAGRQSQVRRDARVCLLCSRGEKHKRSKGSCPTLGPAARKSRWLAGRHPAPCPQLRCPSPGRFLASLFGLSPSQQQPQCLTPRAPARQSPELPTPIRAMSLRDPRSRAERPAGRTRGQDRAFHCLPRAPPALLILFAL